MKKILLSLLALLTVSTFTAHADMTFRDHAGASFTIKTPLTRIVVLNSSNLEMFLAAGGKPLAYAASSTTPEYVAKQLAGIPSVGQVQNPDIERIVALQPELVIGMNFPFHVSMVQTLKGAGIKTALFSPTTPEDVTKVIRLYGELTGNRTKAETSARAIEHSMDRVKKRTASIKKKKVLVLFGSPESYSMVMPNSYTGMMLSAAGGRNITEGIKQTDEKNKMSAGFLPLNLEYVTAGDPDIIMLINHSNKETAAAGSVLSSSPAWSALRAVKNGKVYNLKFETYGINPTVRTGEAVAELSQMIYPELYK